MKYPTMAAVNIAGRLELQLWFNGLPFPGTHWRGKLTGAELQEKIAEEKAILERVYQRWDEEGR